MDIYACPLWIMYNLSFFFFSQVFDNQGSFLTFINTSGDPLYGPQGISITCDGHVVVADSGNHCLKIYRYLQWNLASLWWPQLFFDATTRVILLPIQSTRGIMLLLLFDPTTRVILLPSKPAGRLFRCCCYYHSIQFHKICYLNLNFINVCNPTVVLFCTYCDWEFDVVKIMHSISNIVHLTKYAHNSCFVVVLPVSFRVASLALGQSYDCPSASEANLRNTG